MCYTEWYFTYNSALHVFRGTTEGFIPDHGVQKSCHSKKLQTYTSTRQKHVWDNWITHIRMQVHGYKTRLHETVFLVRYTKHQKLINKNWCARRIMNCKYSDLHPAEGFQLTTRSWVLLEMPPVAKLLKKFSNIYKPKRIITVFTRAIHWHLSWATWIQSMPPNPT
jgi:hypothetical protein